MVGDVSCSPVKYTVTGEHTCTEVRDAYVARTVSPATVDRVDRLVQGGMSASSVVSQLHADGVEHVPSLGSVRSKAFRAAHKPRVAYNSSSSSQSVFLSLDEQQVLQQLTTQSFVRHTQAFPSFECVCVDEDLLALSCGICNNGTGVLFIDTTFKTARQGVIQTNVLVLFRDDSGREAAVPFAFMMHKLKNADTYSVLLACLNRVSAGRLRPGYWYADFDEAVRGAITSSSLGGSLHCDLWHFLRANNKWLAQHQCSDHRKSVTKDLKVIYRQNTQADCQRRIAEFKDKYRPICAQYVDYFHSQWCGKSPHHLWAGYTRFSVNLPSGDQVIESWHSVFKRTHNVSSVSRVDTLALCLKQECAAWSNKLKSPNFSAIMDALVRNRTRQHTRIQPVQSSESLSPMPASSLSSASSSVLSTLLSSSSASSQTIAQAARDACVRLLPPSRSSKQTSCKKCNGNGNAQCTYNMCRQCCATQAVVCKLSSHDRRPKQQSSKQEVCEEIC